MGEHGGPMSDGDRSCASCGATLPPHVGICPQCHTMVVRAATVKRSVPPGYYVIVGLGVLALLFIGYRLLSGLLGGGESTDMAWQCRGFRKYASRIEALTPDRVRAMITETRSLSERERERLAEDLAEKCVVWEGRLVKVDRYTGRYTLLVDSHGLDRGDFVVECPRAANAFCSQLAPGMRLRVFGSVILTESPAAPLLLRARRLERVM